MRLEQRHTGSRRRLGGREEGAANMGRLGESGIKGVREAASGLGPAGIRYAPHGLGLSRAESRGRGRRRRAAPRHPARARLAAGTGLGFGPQSIDRLDLRQGGAEDGKGEPNHAFHAKAGIPFGAILAMIIPRSSIASDRMAGPGPEISISYTVARLGRPKLGGSDCA